MANEATPEMDHTRVDGPTPQAPRSEAAKEREFATDDTALGQIEADVRERLFGASAPGPMRMGRFILLEQLGEGGMGAVHTAYDDQLDRKVAIKVLRADYEDEDEHRQRLQREAQAMARLSHPNVATVHEVGHSQGAVFVAMEFIQGQSLEDWVSTEPPWPEVLAAFIQAGRGLQAAHDAGLVHRDFKPHNAMRTEEGVVKVLDFGLASVTGTPTPTLDPSEAPRNPSSLTSTLTAAGTVMGTPAYMAPEQHRGERADARTDQYAFCIALWRGLAGRRPFEANTLQGLLEVKLEGITDWPDLAPSVPKPIIDALRRGLNAKPEDRWPSMEALLQVLAWDPGRRRRRGMLGIAGLGLAVLGGATVYGWTETRAQRCEGGRAKLDGIWDESRRAEAKASMTSVDRPYATEVWSRSEQVLDDYANAWFEMHREACEATSVRGEQSAAMLDRRMRCLHRASIELEATVDTLSDADADVVDKAHELVAGLRPLSRCGDADALEAEVQPPLPQEAEAVEQAYRRLARSARELDAGRLEVAQAEVEAATTLLVDVDYVPAQGERALQRGLLLEALGDYDAAEASLLEALELALKGGLPKNEVTRVLRQLMYVVGHQQQRMEEGLRYWPFLTGFSVDDLSSAAARDVHGKILRLQGRHEDAEEAHRASLRLREQVLGSEHLATAESRNNLGNAFIAQGRYPEAEAELREALRVREAELGSDHPTIAESRNNLGLVLERQGRLEEAEQVHRAALRSREKVLGPDHPMVAKARSNLGSTLQKQGRYEEAEAEFRAAARIHTKALGPEHLDVAMARNNIGTVLNRMERYEEAEQELRAALRSKEKGLGPDHPAVASGQNNLANALWGQGKLEEAVELYRAALASKEKRLGPDHPSVAASRNNLGSVLHEQERYEEAETEHRAALRIWEKALGPDHPNVAKSRQLLVALLFDLRRYDEALPLAEKAWSRHQQQDIGPKDRADTVFLLARILWSADAPLRDRTRARALAEDAATSYEAVTTPSQGTKVEQVQAWLDEHPAD